jgi:hypothetical protein
VATRTAAARPAKTVMTSAGGDDVFPTSAAALIPFDDDAGDDILGSF